MEENWVLRNQSDIVSQRFKSYMSDILIVDRNGAFLKGKKAQNQIDNPYSACFRKACESDLIFPVS